MAVDKIAFKLLIIKNLKCDVKSIELPAWGLGNTTGLTPFASEIAGPAAVRQIAAIGISGLWGFDAGVAQLDDRAIVVQGISGAEFRDG